VKPSQKVLLIGNGRLARHLHQWSKSFDLLSVRQWNRSQPITLLPDLIQDCDFIWLAIKDDAIQKFYLDHLSDRKNKKIVHFSGSFYHPQLLCAHPLMSFSNELYSEELYRQIHFVIDNCAQLEEALPFFQNTFTRLSPEEKKLYHALCVISGNFPQLLWAQTEKIFGQLKIPTQASEVYIRQITSNYLSQKEAALTGPIVRGDRRTIESNTEALNVAPALQGIYKAFSQIEPKELR
jgi:hypothetical protein